MGKPLFNSQNYYFCIKENPIDVVPQGCKAAQGWVQIEVVYDHSIFKQISFPEPSLLPVTVQEKHRTWDRDQHNS
jgi:hypothetical protein